MLIVGRTGQAAPVATQSFGSWVLTCSVDEMTDRAICILRLRDLLVAPSELFPGVVLEIRDVGGRLLPVVTASQEVAQGPLRRLRPGTQVELRFPPAEMLRMPCDGGAQELACAPRLSDAIRAEQELATASHALFRAPLLPLASGEELGTVRLAFTGTAEAMARYRELVPPTPLRVDPTAREAQKRLMLAAGFGGLLLLAILVSAVVMWRRRMRPPEEELLMQQQLLLLQQQQNQPQQTPQMNVLMR